MSSYCVTCLAWHSTDHRCSAYKPTSNWWALPSTPPLIAAPTTHPGTAVEFPCSADGSWSIKKTDDAPDSKDTQTNRRFFLMSGRRWGKTAALGHTTTNFPQDAPDPGESWPKDAMHDAARSIVHGAKRLVPQARQAVREAVDKADAGPTGRDAQDGALGRALGRRTVGYGLRVGQ